MEPTTVERLLDINHQFYQTFAEHFSQTRQRIQPGVRRILEQLPLTANILDLGCGNGELWRALVAQGFTGFYIGLDSSQGLLEIARRRVPRECPKQPIFLDADLATDYWVNTLLIHTSVAGDDASSITFNQIVAFAVLHHLPGFPLRLRLLNEIYQLLSPEGQFIHSDWQFHNNPKLTERIQPWSMAGLDDAQVDAGDYLLDWRHGGRGLRYVHQFDEVELSALAEKSHFQIGKTFYSDGGNGKSGLYQVWTAVK